MSDVSAELFGLVCSERDAALLEIERLRERVALLEAAQPRGLKALIAAVKGAIATGKVNHLATVLRTYEAGAYDAGNSLGTEADDPYEGRTPWPHPSEESPEDSSE